MLEPRNSISTGKGGYKFKNQFTMVVLLFPPRADGRSFVRTKSLDGICSTPFPVAASARALRENKVKRRERYKHNYQKQI